jgi:DNA-binding transcriptional ArsR family regulator
LAERSRSVADSKKGRKRGPCKCDLVAAINHKVRRRMLRLLNEAEDPLSPTMITDLLEMQLSNVSYHMNVLRKCDAVAVVEEKQVRGAVEHFYVSKVADNAAVEAMLEETEADDTKGEG